MDYQRPGSWAAKEAAFLRSLDPSITSPIYPISGEWIEFDAQHSLARWNAKGYAHHALDAFFSQFLQARGNWRDRGLCLVAESHVVSGEQRKLLIHEYAHLLQKDPPIAHLSVAGCLGTFNPSFNRERFTQLAGLTAEDESNVPWAKHGDRFHRCLLHLIHRANCNGLRAQPDEFYGGSFYGLSSMGKYFASLNGECHRLQSRPIRSILATPLPPRFRELWWRDTGIVITDAKPAPTTEPRPAQKPIKPWPTKPTEPVKSQSKRPPRVIVSDECWV